jgi:hypothetical protein
MPDQRSDLSPVDARDGIGRFTRGKFLPTAQKDVNARRESQKFCQEGLWITGIEYLGGAFASLASRTSGLAIRWLLCRACVAWSRREPTTAVENTKENFATYAT